jgi:tyrosinase
MLSPNPELYGNLHNMTHMFLSYQHDPDHRHLESFAPIGESSVAMRDPVFYRLHQYTDDLFQQFLVKLPPYTAQQLTFPGISVSGIQAQQDGGRANVFNTHWQESDVNLSKGLDFVPRGDIFAR